MATQPIRDGIDILDGLSEGEIRERAIARFGTDVVIGVGTAELIDMLKND